MNNEDKILAMLEAMASEMNDRFQSIEAKQDTASEQLLKLEIKMENETDRAIKLLAEGHEILNRKLDEVSELEPRVEVVEHKVSALEYLAKAE